MRTDWTLEGSLLFSATASVQREALDSLEPKIACGGRSTP